MSLQASLQNQPAAPPVALRDVHDPELDASKLHFDHNLFYSFLPSHIELGSTLLAANQLASTQTLLQDNNTSIPDNTVCIAYQQIGGKGDSSEGTESPFCLKHGIALNFQIQGGEETPGSPRLAA